MPMLAAAGIVVTLISTPISAPGLGRAEAEHARGAGADGDDERRTRPGSRCSRRGRGRRCRRRPGSGRRRRRSAWRARWRAIASGKPSSSAMAERRRELGRASGRARRTGRRPGRTPGRRPSRPRPGSALSRKIPIAAMIAGQHHVEQEDAGQLDALVRALVELLPDDGVGGRAGRVGDRGVGEVRDRVGRAERDRPVVVQAELPQVGDDHARVLGRDVAHHEVPVGPRGGVLDPDHVDRRRRVAQQRVDPIGPVRRRHDPQMDHARSLFGGRCKIGCRAVGAIWLCAAGSAIWAFGIPDVALFSVRPRP